MKSRRMNCAQSPQGFTLLELLVATAVGAIVLLVINATFFGALRLHNTTHARIDQDLVLQRALGIVRRDLAGLMLPNGVLSGQLQTTQTTSVTQDVQGDRITPDLYTNTGKVDGWNPFSEVQIVAYYLAPATDGSSSKNLIRVVTRNLLPVQNPDLDQQTLLTGLTDAAVEYYDGSNWTDTWDSTVTSTMPAAIKFSLTLMPLDPSQPNPAPVELVVPVAVMAQATAAATSGQ